MTTDYPDNNPQHPSKYNLKNIPPGASVFFPDKTPQHIHKSACAARKWSPGLILRVKCRSVMKNGTLGTKVTRIE